MPGSRYTSKAAFSSSSFIFFISREQIHFVPVMASNGTNGVNTSNYIRWNAEGIERIPPNKKEDIQAVADMINVVQKTHYNTTRHLYSCW